MPLVLEGEPLNSPDRGRRRRTALCIALALLGLLAFYCVAVIVREDALEKQLARELTHAGPGSLPRLRALARVTQNLWVRGSNGETVLHYAARYGDPSFIDEILRSDVWADARDHAEVTPLQIAVSADRLDNVRALLAHRADANALVVDPRGLNAPTTPLIAAAATGDREIMLALLTHGADPNRATPDGWTPIMEAAVMGRPESARCLLEHGARANVRRGGGLKPLGEAESVYSETLAALLRHQAAPKFRRSALYLPDLRTALERKRDLRATTEIIRPYNQP